VGAVTTADAEVTELATRIGELAEERRARVFRSSWWTDRMLGWAMNHPSFRTALFRFVDVFPATVDDADVARHLREYLDDAETPAVVGLGLDASDRVPFGEQVAASVARRSIARMGQQFIIGRTPADAIDPLHRLWQAGRAFTVDLLGEHTVADVDADQYARRLDELLTTIVDATSRWEPNERLERDPHGVLPRANISIKPTALAPAFDPLTRDDGIAQAVQRLRPFLERARDAGAFVWFDMEHYDVKELTHELFRRLLDEPSLSSLPAGIVVQAYLRDSHHDLEGLLDWARDRPVPIGVRLVKGAYWDTETILSSSAGWQVPVYQRKAQTDANYERCTKLLLQHADHVRPAFGSHNLRSLANAIVQARSLGVPDDGYEIQLLHGMAEPVHDALTRLGARVRVYAPVGEIVPGMAYLVRRLLENTSNDSFVRMRFLERRSLDEQLAPPDADLTVDDADPDYGDVTADHRLDRYRPEPHAEFRRGVVRERFGESVRDADSRLRDVRVSGLIDGVRVDTSEEIVSVDPGDVDRVVARSASCGIGEADRAIEAARAAWPEWSARPAEERAAVLSRAASWMRDRRFELAAQQVFEAGKPWAEADGDVCEAIDFCEYYALESLRLDHGGAVQSPPGETNALRYRARGIGVVIAPWNFPLAICTGMVTAGLVTGNAVIFKPAEQTPLVASALVDALVAAGVPRGVLAFLPGRGEVVGAYLVSHPEVAFVAFTGSKEVGLGIVQAAAVPQPGQRHVKRVIAEMGGKNAVIVDADADLDQAVPAVVHSAFGFAGQKCSAASRVVVLDAVHDQFVPRLVDAMRGLRVGHPRDPNVVVGPVIDADAYERISRYVEKARDDGTVHDGGPVPERGLFLPPRVVLELPPGSPVLVDEIFGPVLAVQRAADFDHALALANDTPFALTAGVFSRSPANIERAGDALRAGNVYVNRGTTGAVVGRQPFGGYGLSGVGSKAGGPDYLLQFTEPRVVTENTLRQGFAPDQPGPL
jgi:RHH-type proline utilization regulon transcriptional repressor/proline dehydrogenase/delta 1-pyrroline-5-carboxylate dehydrogenase